MEPGAEELSGEAEDDEASAAHGGFAEAPADDQRGGDDAAQGPHEHDGSDDAGGGGDGAIEATLHVKRDVRVEAEDADAEQHSGHEGWADVAVHDQGEGEDRILRIALADYETDEADEGDGDENHAGAHRPIFAAEEGEGGEHGHAA